MNKLHVLWIYVCKSLSFCPMLWCVFRRLGVSAPPPSLRQRLRNWHLKGANGPSKWDTICKNLEMWIKMYVKITWTYLEYPGRIFKVEYPTNIHKQYTNNYIQLTSHSWCLLNSLSSSPHYPSFALLGIRHFPKHLHGTIGEQFARLRDIE